MFRGFMSRGSLARLLVVLIGLMLVPGAATAAATEGPDDACASVATELEGTLREAVSEVDAPAPDRRVLMSLLRTAEAGVLQAQRDGCLPATTLGENLSGCEVGTEDLLGDLLRAIGAVLSDLLELVRQLLEDLLGLIGGLRADCLPEAPGNAST